MVWDESDLFRVKYPAKALAPELLDCQRSSDIITQSQINPCFYERARLYLFVVGMR